MKNKYKKYSIHTAQKMKFSIKDFCSDKLELLKPRKCNIPPKIFAYDAFKERELNSCQRK